MTPPAPAAAGRRPRLPSLVRLRVPLGFAAGLVYVATARPTPARLLGGLPLVVAGCALRLLASGWLEKNRRLAVSGPYARLRHPLYAGSALLLAGFLAAAAPLAVALALALAFAAVYAAVARREEQVLRERFGAEFEAWRAAVPALLPRLRPWRGGEGAGSFSWPQVRRHRELRTVAAAAAALLLLAVRALLAPGRPFLP